jgi:hypothetical protein
LLSLSLFVSVQVSDAYVNVLSIIVFFTGYFLGQWKVSQIITILKPGKLAEEVNSYRPISLHPILSKLFEKLFLTRLKPTLQETRIIPDHQFSFRQNILLFSKSTM